MTEAQWLVSEDPQAMLRLFVPGFAQAEGVGSHEAKPRFSVSERKLRLFGIAFWREFIVPIVPPADPLVTLREKDRQIAEDLADGKLTGLKARRLFDQNHGIGFTVGTHWMLLADRLDCAWLVEGSLYRDYLRQPGHAQRAADLVRCIVGNPFNPLKAQKLFPLLRPEWRMDIPAIRVAHAIYEERRWDELGVLADALEEAGVTNEALLMHCRNKKPCEVCFVLQACEKMLGRPPEENDPDCQFCHGTGWEDAEPIHTRGCWAVDMLLGKS